VHLSPGYQRARRRVLKREEGLCQLCGRADGLRVHHVVSGAELLRRGLDPNLDSNLVLVCDACHRRLHGRATR